MRIVKISALALLLSAPLVSVASAADLATAPEHHCFLFHKHAHSHPILDFLKALCHKP